MSNKDKPYRGMHQFTPQQYAKRKARWTVTDAIKCGKMARGTVCVFASNECSGKIEAHHDDYSKPLEVRWLCRKHHLTVDGHKMARHGMSNAAIIAMRRLGFEPKT